MTLTLQELVIRLSALERRVVELEQENADLKKEIHFLKLENKALREENDRLRERLGLNSSNSSLPPSRDLYKKKKGISSKSGLKPGGQPGHVGKTRKKLPADKEITIHPESWGTKPKQSLFTKSICNYLSCKILTYESSSKLLDVFKELRNFILVEFRAK